MVTPGPRQGSPPSTPPDFRVTSLVYNSVTFDWDPVSGEFLLYRVQVSRNSAYTDLLYNIRISPDEVTLTALTGSTEYWARVRAEDINGMSGWNSISFITPEESNPPTTAPSGLSITQILNNSARASWNSVSLAARYRIQIDDTSNFFSPLINTTTTNLTYLFSGLSSSTPYYVRVRAENDDGVGPWSNSQVFTTQPDPTAPTAAPGGLSITEILHNSARASWNSVSLAARYRIQIDDTSNFFSPLIDTTTTNLTYLFSGLSSSTPYYVRVRAENDDGVGPWSNSVSFRTDQEGPTARSISFTFQAIQASSPRDVTFDFISESEEEIPPVQMPSTGFDIAVVDRDTNNAYRVNPSDPGSQSGGYGSLGRPSGVDSDDNVRAIARIGNTLYWFLTTDFIHSLNIDNGTSTNHGRFQINGIITGADYIGNSIFILVIDNFPDHTIRRLNFPNGNAVFVGFTPDDPDNGNPALLGAIARDPVSGDYFGVTPFEGDLYRVNPSNTDSSAGVYGKVGSFSGLSFPHAMAFIDGVPYITGPNTRRIYQINLSNASVTNRGLIYSGPEPFGMTSIPKAPINRLGTPIIQIVDVQTRSALLLITRSAQATSYRIRVIRTIDAVQVRIILTTNATVLLDELSTGTEYRVEVQALTTATNIDDSHIATETFRTDQAMAVMPPTAAPSGLSITEILHNSARASWNSVSLATRYRVEIYNTDNIVTPLISTTTTNLTYLFSGLTSSTHYFVDVRAENDGGIGPWSNSQVFTTQPEPTAPTSAPGGLSITQILNNSARASWNSVSLAARYRIQIDDTSNFFSPLINTTTTNLTYLFSGLTSSTPYYVRVRAENDSGIGPWSNSQVFTTQSDPTAPTSAPSGLSITEILHNSARASWNSVSLATIYGIQADNTSDFSSPLINRVTTSLSYQLSGLPASTLHYVRVRAENDDGVGPWSNVVTFRTDQEGPTARSISFTFRVTPGPRTVTFTFQATPGPRTVTFTFQATPGPRTVTFDLNVPVPPIDPAVISIIRIGFQSITFTSEHQPGPFQNEEYFWIIVLDSSRVQGTFAPYEIVHQDGLDQETEYRLLMFPIRGGVLGDLEVEVFTTRSPESVEWGYFAIMAVPRPFIFNFDVVPGLRDIPRNVQVDFITVPQLPSHVLYDFQATPRIARPIEFNFYASPVVPRSAFFEFNSVEPFPREVNLDFQAESFNPEEVLFIFHAVLPTPRPVEIDFLAVAPRTVRFDFENVLPNPRFVFFTFSAYSDILLPAPSINSLVPRMIEELAVPVIESDTKAHIHLGAGNDRVAEILGPLPAGLDDQQRRPVRTLRSLLRCSISPRDGYSFPFLSQPEHQQQDTARSRDRRVGQLGRPDRGLNSLHSYKRSRRLHKKRC